MTKHKGINPTFEKYLVATIGCIIYSLGVDLFLSPNGISSGGFTGIALIVEYLINTYAPGFKYFSTGIFLLIINIPVFIVGAIYFGKHFAVSTIYSTVLSSLLMAVFEKLLENVVPLTDNTLIAAVAGGALFALGLGLIFKVGSSTAGTDIIIKLLKRKFRHIKTGQISVTVDIVIVVIAAICRWDLAVGFEQGIYSAISLVVFMFVFDYVLYGGNTATLVYIVPSGEDSTNLCSMLMQEIDTGATYIDGYGAYSGDRKKVIMCVCKKTSYPHLRDIVRREDPKAFIIVSSAKEVFGEGYRDNNEEDI